MNLDDENMIGKKLFRYYNMWSLAEGFIKKVRTSWEGFIYGVFMYCLVMKLKRLRSVLRQINAEGFLNIETEER